MYRTNNKDLGLLNSKEKLARVLLTPQKEITRSSTGIFEIMMLMIPVLLLRCPVRLADKPHGRK